MSLAVSSIALRAIPAAFILNSGLGKLQTPPEASAGMQQFAATGISAVNKLPADKFGKILGAAETALGAALLTPFVSNRLAGAGLTAFGAGLMTLYFGNEGNTEDDGIRPSSDGTTLAKDSWLVALGVGLMALPKGEKKAKKNKK
ncbi:hypothetical protein [Corynebacterium lubricantis]|uniref:hypothetical protein n=1 Tax=Corynebacterium lubricantis TaxID=541095 RepID=UPI000377AEFB|nr:hypothetical protein [Corynebacterium lubricantis]